MKIMSLFHSTASSIMICTVLNRLLVYIACNLCFKPHLEKIPCSFCNLRSLIMHTWVEIRRTLAFGLFEYMLQQLRRVSVALTPSHFHELRIHFLYHLTPPHTCHWGGNSYGNACCSASSYIFSLFTGAFLCPHVCIPAYISYLNNEKWKKHFEIFSFWAFTFYSNF